jgi:hypothetical protein
LAVRRLAARSFPKAHGVNSEDLAPVLGLAPPDAEDPASRARFLSAAYEALLELVPEQRRGSVAALERWIEEGAVRVDFSRFAFGPDLLARIPESPGIYLMRDRAGEVIYVGKSGNLKRRVRSYFTPRALSGPKVARIHELLYSMEFLTCATEIEALLLEIRLIRDFQPPINLQCEVHERARRYGRGQNLLILIPAEDKVEVYFVKDGTFAAQRSVPLGDAPGPGLQKKIRSVFFSSGGRKAVTREEWESEIVFSWFHIHRKVLNYIDVDDSGSCEIVIRRLECYLRDPDQLKHKVFYR